MTITYRIRADDAFYKAMIDRYDQQRPKRLRFSTQYNVAGLVFSITWLLMTRPLTWRIILQSVAVGAMVALGGVVITKWGILWRFRRRPETGQEYEVTLSEEGLSATGPHVQSNWTWPAYPNSARFQDGHLLMRKGTIRWLPDAAIVSGDATAATALIASKTTLRHLDR